MSKEMSNAEFDSAMSAIPAVEKVIYTRGAVTPGMEMVYEGKIGAKLPGPAETRYLACCKQELALKIALKAVQEEKKETEKELADLALIGQVKFEW